MSAPPICDGCKQAMQFRPVPGRWQCVTCFSLYESGAALDSGKNQRGLFARSWDAGAVAYYKAEAVVERFERTRPIAAELVRLALIVLAFWTVTTRGAAR